MSEGLPPAPLPRIRQVWGGHPDFEDGGLPYVAFVIENDLADMRSAQWDAEECREELADISINALRALDELTEGPPEAALLDRLESRMEGRTEAIIEEYQRRYEQRPTETPGSIYPAEPVIEDPAEPIDPDGGE